MLINFEQLPHLLRSGNASMSYIAWSKWSFIVFDVFLDISKALLDSTCFFTWELDVYLPNFNWFKKYLTQADNITELSHSSIIVF